MTATRRAFFVTPIGDEGSEVRERSDKVLEYILAPALKGAGLVSDIERADHNPNPGEITSSVIASILDSDLIVADLTGSNPNVYYEVALAHAFNKPVVHIRHATEDRLPFDIKDVRVFEYSFDIAAAEAPKRSVSAASEHALNDPSSVMTPVDRGRTIAQSAQSTDPAARATAEILERLDAMDSRLAAAIHGNPRPYGTSLSSQERRLLDAVRFVASLNSMLAADPGLSPSIELERKRAQEQAWHALNSAISEEESRNRHPSSSLQRESLRIRDGLPPEEVTSSARGLRGQS